MIRFSIALKRALIFVCVLQGSLLLSFVFSAPSTAQAAIPSNPDLAYLRVWERTDYLVALGATQRSWYWGPAPFSVTDESYQQSPSNFRQVHYWDKSRMEITKPGGDRNSKWYVTNGLLVREMVSGRVQTGDDSYYNWGSANVPVAGDTLEFNPSAPTYSSFKDIASLNLDKRALPSTRPVITTLEKDGETGINTTLATRYPETTIAYYESKLGHNIPAPFWRFMNLAGPVTINHRTVNQVIEDWVFAFGLPITEPYWTRSRVAGVEKDVMVQLFERRVLTYTPSNAPAFQVEMGNVGRHYFAWRYERGVQPPKAPVVSEPVTRITIPSIGVDAVIEYVSLAADGNMDTPFRPENVAWYKPGARIGDKGNAVVSGHLDYAGIGPVVFWNLNKLKSGDLVYVTTSMGNKYTFRVTSSEIYFVNNAPLERIFGDSFSSNLNLITCNGIFDRGSASYDRRLVVFTTLVA
jgi:LPXTG-site transpeptidase (sortase) family protein